MTTDTAVASVPLDVATDRRGSWIPTPAMISSRIMELRKRKGIMITTAVVLIGLPSLFLAIRLIAHLADPKSYGPAGGADIFTSLVAGVMYVFGFIVAALIGCTAGSTDLSDGMFRHLVVTGRSRLALYLARIPAGLAIIVSMMAIGFTIVCVVCCFAAPTAVSYNGTNVPPGLSLSGFEAWAGAHPDAVYCNFNYNGPNPPPANISCGPNGSVLQGPAWVRPADAQRGAAQGRRHGDRRGLRQLPAVRSRSSSCRRSPSWSARGCGSCSRRRSGSSSDSVSSSLTGSADSVGHLDDRARDRAHAHLLDGSASRT